MSAGFNSEIRMNTLNEVQPQDVRDFTGLLEVLTTSPQNPQIVESNLLRATDSELTTVYTIRAGEAEPVIATATLNRLPVLSDRGSVMWIDDVVTNPSSQGRGLSKMLMDTMESKAAQSSDSVLLTSSPDRGPARAGYTKRGYALFPEGLKVFRTTELSTERPADTKMMQDYTTRDIEEMAELTGQDPATLEVNLSGILDSVTSAVFERRQRGALTALAVANICPIPVGLKPWIDDISGNTPEDKRAVVRAGEVWMSQQGAPYANIVAAFPEGLADTYAARASGLFIKRFDTV